MTITADSIEPQIGGEVNAHQSAWPGGVWHVWLRVEDYSAAAHAEVVLTPREAARVAWRLLWAALRITLPSLPQLRLSDPRGMVQARQKRGEQHG